MSSRSPAWNRPRRPTDASGFSRCTTTGTGSGRSPRARGTVSPGRWRGPTRERRAVRRGSAARSRPTAAGTTRSRTAKRAPATAARCWHWGRSSAGPSSALSGRARSGAWRLGRVRRGEPRRTGSPRRPHRPPGSRRWGSASRARARRRLRPRAVPPWSAPAPGCGTAACAPAGARPGPRSVAARRGVPPGCRTRRRCVVPRPAGPPQPPPTPRRDARIRGRTGRR